MKCMPFLKNISQEARGAGMTTKRILVRYASSFCALYWTAPPPRWYHCFDVVVGFAWSKDPENHAGQVKHDDPEEKGYPGPLGWGLGVRPTTSPRKNVHVEKTLTMSRMGPINRRLYYRYKEYEDGGNQLNTGKNGGPFWGWPGSRKGCSAIHGRTDGWMDTNSLQMFSERTMSSSAQIMSVI